MGAMTVPYVFAGITVSLALTRSPFPVSLVYGVDLLGAALGCAAVLVVLNVLDGPTAILFAALMCRCRRRARSRAARRRENAHALVARRLWRRPALCTCVVLAAAHAC